MFELLSTTNIRPSTIEPEGKKDEKYHSDFARWCLGQANNYLHNDWVAKIFRNRDFYKGNQWVDREDRETFLKDVDGQDRQRIAMVLNQIQPMVEQYRGNAIRMNINAKCKGISPQVINRRETKLNEMLHYSNIANA